MDKFLTILRVPELRSKLITTFVLLFIYRLGFHIPLPGIDLEQVAVAANKADENALFGIMNAFTGAGVGQAVLFSLGVMPYISASIIFSLLTKVVPSLEALSKEGASGQKKISQLTRLATVPICLLQSVFVVQAVIYNPSFNLMPGGGSLFYTLTIMLALTAGTIFIMWIGEQITEYGMGNGVSLIIMAGIIANLPSTVTKAFSMREDGHQLAVTLGLMWLLIVIVVVYLTRGQRRIPIQQAKLTRGRKVMGGQKHYLPLKVNQAGVMPIIFASALFIVPNVLGAMPGFGWLQSAFNHSGFVYLASYTAMIIFFSFMWTRLMFQPDEIATNLKENGSFIPGIRPGKATAEYLSFVLDRITLAGSVFLAVIAVMPNILIGNLHVDPMIAYFLGGTSILIVVGVALDMVDRVNAQLVMRNYDGFMKGSKSSWTKKRT
ncbi:MAG: preprotein translocase subunit SecY [Planctomycetes bacterium]|nr:preprotein translocase subunit SecY [Planctomycetota bacterium]MCP4770289.1 preprotein translocase subunit SecY [Planctomycetota bacterium]MCP4861463.1 preprotein translocase subunit SecY [Planctomycetota bacterium]